VHAVLQPRCGSQELSTLRHFTIGNNTAARAVTLIKGFVFLHWRFTLLAGYLRSGMQ
jgi:hypothetical protein